VNYILYLIILFLIFLVVFVINHLAMDAPPSVRVMLSLPSLVVYLGILISVFAVGAQRCRDLNWPGWAVFLTITPLAGYVLSLLLLILPGTKGENRYGKPPGYESNHQLHA